MFDAECNLAAIVYGVEDDPDRLLLDFAGDLQRGGRRVVGVVQLGRISKTHDATLVAVILPSAAVVDLDHERGRVGCRPHAGRLASIAGALADEIAAGADLVIINRFGKLEAGGEGLVGLIRQAVDADIPVLTAVPETYFATCIKYTGGMNVRLPCRRAALDQWWASVMRGGAARGETTGTFCEIAK
jgi:Protein of unknown function (DUF2478)